MKLRMFAVGVLAALLLGGSQMHVLGAPNKVCNVPSGKFPTLTKALAKKKCSTINLAAGTYHENNLYVNHNVTITGAGAADTILDADGETLFYIADPTDVFNLSGVTLQNAGQDPGALMLDTDVTASVADSIIQNNNRAIWIDGGTLTLSHVTVRDNTAVEHSAGIFREYSPGTLTIDHSKFIKNRAPCAAAIYTGTENAAQLVITNSTFKKNKSDGAGCLGGAIYTEDPAHITRSNFVKNSNEKANGAGGAIFQDDQTLEIEDSYFAKNRAAGGGAIYAAGGARLKIATSTFERNSTFVSHGGAIYSFISVTVLNSTFSGNTADAGAGVGGALALFGSVTHNIVNVTFSGNSASSGGTLLIGGSAVHLKNSILNAGTPNNCVVGGSVLTSHGSNISSDASCDLYLTEASDKKSTDALLDVLAKNGGPTKTHALLENSPALDAVVDCTDHLGDAVTTDQRGVERPQGDACDSGAYEGE